LSKVSRGLKSAVQRRAVINGARMFSTEKGLKTTVSEETGV
jgi:hypothetical protein